MTMATATSEKAKFTSEKSTFCTGKTQRCTLTFLSSGAAPTIDVRAWFVDSDMTAKVTLPTIKYSGYISGVIDPLRPWPKIVENTMAMTIIISSGLSTDHATPRTLRRYLILKSLVTS